MRLMFRRAARRALAIYVALCGVAILFDLFWWARNPR